MRKLMSRLFFLILTAVALSVTSCRNIKADSSTESLPVLLDMLDNDLDNSETYEKARLARISAIRSMDDDAGYRCIRQKLRAGQGHRP